MARRKYKFGKPVAGAALNIKVVPRASRDEIVGLHTDGVVKVRVKAPPADGAANEAVIKLLARALGVKPRDIEIVAGHASTLKLLSIVGLTATQVDERLGFATGVR